jgi:putative transposase
MQASLVLDALEQAAHSRPDRVRLIHHSDHGSQYLYLRYSERLTAAGVVPSVGTVGDSYDNALAEAVIGPHKTEVIRRQGPWRHVDAVEMATLT